MAQRAFIAASGLSLVLLALPAPWHIRANNSGTILYIFWSFLGNLVYLINTVIWSGNIRNPSPIWCDICTFFWPARRSCCCTLLTLALVFSQ